MGTGTIRKGDGGGRRSRFLCAGLLTSWALLALLAGAASAADGPARPVPQEGAAVGSAVPPALSETGALRLEFAPGQPECKVGPNSIDIILSDPGGRRVEGALVAVTPWMPSMGHGVWEKPVVRELGAGRYRVENLVLIMAGSWELRLAVRKGMLEDRGVLTLAVPQAEPERPEAERTGYDSSVVEYRVPEVTLVNQDGKEVRLAEFLGPGKAVILDFIFTTCTTVCPIMSAGFTNLRRELGADAAKVQLVSISIDPENDRPETLKRYQERFQGGPGWEFLTGSREDVGTVLRAFNASVADKMSHEPLYLLRAPGAERWARIKGLVKKRDLMSEYLKLQSTPLPGS